MSSVNRRRGQRPLLRHFVPPGRLALTREIDMSNHIHQPLPGRLRRPAIQFLGSLIASVIGAVLMVLLGTLLPTKARADELAEPLAGWTLGTHIGSRHFPEREHLHDANPGLYAMSPGGWVGGGYRNSLGRVSLYGGRVFEAGPAALTVGLISGYRRRATVYEQQCSDPHYTWCVKWDTGVKTEVTALIAPSVRLPELWGVSARLSYLPSYGQLKSNALHLSLERRL